MAEDTNEFVESSPIGRELRYPVPNMLNLSIAFIQFTLLLFLLYCAGQVERLWTLGLVMLSYGIVMNSAYATLHEAEHNMFHTNRRINVITGVVLSLFFPTAFHFIRQGHLGHHMRNRSDDEAFDFYFEGENRIWKFLQFYGILTGLFWVVIVLTNIITIIYPAILKQKPSTFDRPIEALLDSLNPRYETLIRLEALAAILLHVTLSYFFSIPVLNHLLVLFSFGFMWSTVQYMHHYGTDRDVCAGALNVKTFGLLDRILLNHNWHLHHHMNPTVPWIYLPKLRMKGAANRENFFRVYLRQWRGPRFSKERVRNRYAGKIIK